MGEFTRVPADEDLESHFLAGRHPACASALSLAHRFGLPAARFVRDCWVESASAKYRASGFSRRAAWHISLPILSGYNLVSDACMDTDPLFLLVDLLLFLGEIFVTWGLPPQSWWCDIIMVAAVEAAFGVGLLLSAAGRQYSQTTASLNTFGTLFFSHLCGVNTFAVFAGVSVNLVVTSAAAPEEFPLMAFSSLLLVPWAILVDSAAVMAQGARGAVHKLLDDCNDGFFSVNLGTGQMGGASDKMQELFGLPPDCSRRFMELVVADDVPRLDHLLAEARRGSLEATVLSCRAASQLFDCKLIPYFACLNELYLCFQVVGEARMETAPCPEGSQEQGSSCGSEGRSDQRTMVIAAGAEGADGGPCGSDDGSDVTFDVASSYRAPTAALSYSATHTTDALTHSTGRPRGAAQLSDACTQTPGAEGVDAASQTAGNPPTRVPSSAGSSSEGSATSGSKRAPARSRKKTRHVQLCSSRRFLPQFAATPERFMSVQLADLLPRYNTTGSGCCKYHIAVARLASVLRAMHDGPCRPAFCPFDAWQCGRCYSMNARDDVGEEGEPVCALCSAEEPILPQTPSAT